MSAAAKHPDPGSDDERMMLAALEAERDADLALMATIPEEYMVEARAELERFLTEQPHMFEEPEEEEDDDFAY